MNWRRRPDLNRGWRFCRPLPYHLATAPIEPETQSGPRWPALHTVLARRCPPSPPCRAASEGISQEPLDINGAKADGAGNGIRTRDFDLGKVALYH